MEKIKFTHLRKLLTCQPYFVWNSIDVLEETDDDEFEFRLPGAIDTLDLSKNITTVQVRTFNKIERDFFEYVKEMGRVAWLKQTLTVEEKVLETKKLLRDTGVDIIFNPTFEYEGAFASPTFYDKVNKKISNLKISTSTKRIDLIKPYFDYQIMDKSGVEVNSISYFILDTKKYRAFETAFYETFRVNTSTGSRTSKEGKDLSDFVKVRKKKSGNGYKANGEPDEVHTIFDIVAKASAFGTKNNPIQFDSINFYLRKIKEAEASEFAGKLTEDDATPFGKNPYINELLEYLKSDAVGYNGKFVKTKDILEGKTLKEIGEEVYLVKMLLEGKAKVSSKEELQEMSNRLDNSRVIWYDFEGFSLPFPTIDGYTPFQQATFQVSTIETDKMKETEVINTIFDPKVFNYTDFPGLIDQIYANKADAYVVYNAGYENSRLKEMVQVLKDMNHEDWKECLDKINHIIDKTIDLAIPFAATSKDSLPQIFIPELKGKHSIKLIEKYITNKQFPFANMITPYKDLEIQNGGMAMEAAIHRAINVTKDNEWAEKQDLLKQYCENDVRAMIMVYALIKEMLKQDN